MDKILPNHKGWEVRVDTQSDHPVRIVIGNTEHHITVDDAHLLRRRLNQAIDELDCIAASKLPEPTASLLDDPKPALNLLHDFDQRVSPLFNKYRVMGYRARDIFYLLTDSLANIAASHRQLDRHG